MFDPHKLSPETVARLEKHAKPFTDTVDTVVNRILDTYEATLELTDNDDLVVGGTPKDFDPSAPPNLTHTKVLSVHFNRNKLPREDANWNGLLNEAVRVARKHAKTDDELRRVLLANFLIGKKEDEGYRYLADINLSVQGQDANSAWKATFNIARLLKLPFEVVFAWRLKPEASHPGVTGRFFYQRVRVL
jgi:hypothetical protein